MLAEVGRRGEITVGGMKERTGLSRKYLIPLLEWADRRGLTRRVGEARRLT
jgi:selenocysteine-specific elongation factor